MLVIVPEVVANSGDSSPTTKLDDPKGAMSQADPGVRSE
jgi:hypothetical protein